MNGVVISEFEWDDDNIIHIARHGYTPEEVVGGSSEEETP